ncbi:MAG: diguanylate cyclase [Alphaproteobacteria bacterium]|uniref:Diguanylate cyclase n=1 Tax=Candidatus Nitrobium versatile TaxID=2884831 RepID=A0A953J846_9BACT|nr:diguanylate cyclase [Candidatus Nitrobium versatile]
MKVCFPVQEDEGMESMVYGHFGSAPMFVMVDTATRDTLTIINRDQHHAHGACNPLKALDSHKVDAVIVGGIGGGALTRLNQSGIRVFQAGAARIKENMDMFLAMQLPEYTLRQSCGGHAQGGGCAH